MWVKISSFTTFTWIYPWNSRTRIVFYPTTFVNSKILPPSLYFFTSRDNLRHSMIYSTIIPRSSLYFSMTYVKTHTYMGYNSKIPSYLSTEPLKPQDCVDLNQGHRCWRPQILVPLNCLIRSFFFLLRRVMFCFPIRQYLYINTI